MELATRPERTRAAERLGVSAVIPNYNHARYLPDAVRALAAQQPPPAEIIVVDDASTDDSLEVLAQLGQEISTLRVVKHEQNAGAIAALNRGIGEARHELVYFGAADDLTAPGLIERLAGALAQHPGAAFASGEAKLVDLQDRFLGIRPPVRPSQTERFFSPSEVIDLLRRCDNWILTGAALFRREQVVEAGGFAAAARSFTDGLLARHLALKSGFVYVPAVFVTWRVNPEGYSRSATSQAEVARQTIDSMRRLIAADPLFPSWYPELLERRWRFSVGRVAVVESGPAGADVLTQFCARGSIDRLIYRIAGALGKRTGSVVSLGWLFLRERPMLLRDLFLTTLSRRIHGA
ncbi:MULTISPECIES: glycosyltransferase family 2 protein [unclassified Bradyrhizobium]|uniref:glycosyltransferase family 2 protein n=1 Tax=unclassified Bradyrhizobium TaxID=2631580 RepID=UPI0028E6454C|nr:MULTISPECIES: glycosyltransferase family 2 protein [unclassified Bradyrhizobium]